MQKHTKGVVEKLCVLCLKFDAYTILCGHVVHVFTAVHIVKHNRTSKLKECPNTILRSTRESNHQENMYLSYIQSEPKSENPSLFSSNFVKS